MHGPPWIALSSCRIISIFCCGSEAMGRRGRRPLQMRMAGRSRTARMPEIRFVCAGRFVNRPYDGNVRFSPHRYPRQDRRLPGGASPSPTTGRSGFHESVTPRQDRRLPGGASPSPTIGRPGFHESVTRSHVRRRAVGDAVPYGITVSPAFGGGSKNPRSWR